MYVVAFIADVLGLLEFVPFVGPVISFIVDVLTAGVFMVFSPMMEVNLYSQKQVGYTLVAFGVEALLGFVPAWTIRVYLAKQQHRKEKKDELAQLAAHQGQNLRFADAEAY